MNEFYSPQFWLPFFTCLAFSTVKPGGRGWQESYTHSEEERLHGSECVHIGSYSNVACMGETAGIAELLFMTKATDEEEPDRTQYEEL